MRHHLPRTLAIAALTLLCAASLAAQHKPAAKAAAKAPAKPAGPVKLGPGLYATFDTSKGKFIAQLYPQWAPKAVANFVGLAEGTRPYKDPRLGTLSTSKLYEGLLFFRTIPDYMLQTGDLLNNGQGSLGYTIPFEKNSLKFDQPGRMALAQAPGDPTSRGAQVFFTLKPVPTLDKQGYLIIGQIVAGMDVAKALSEGPRKGGASDIPEYPPILRHVTIQTIH
ncbi:MAG TPA: peptidylprolyl isomerase [Terriglobales bacterium]|nr:peptidylprolyl isomerase [Terriglobales bacterium]